MHPTPVLAAHQESLNGGVGRKAKYIADRKWLGDLDSNAQPTYTEIMEEQWLGALPREQFRVVVNGQMNRKITSLFMNSAPTGVVRRGGCAIG